MSKHRNPPPRLAKQPSPDHFHLPDALDVLREVIGRTDALLYATESHFERFGWRCECSDESDNAERSLEHLAHLLGAARESASAAVSLGATIAAELDRRGAAA